MGKRQLAAGLMEHVAKGDRVATRRTSVNAYQDAAKPRGSDCAVGNRGGFFSASACRGDGVVGHINLLRKAPVA